MTVEVFLNSRDRSLSEAAALEAALRGEPLFSPDDSSLERVVEDRA